jgi:hypothetical protein
MKVKFTGASPIRFGDRPVRLGDVIDLPQKQAEEALSSGNFVPVEESKPKSKSKKKSESPAKEES